MKIRLVDTPKFPVRLAFAQHLFTAGTVGGEGEPAHSVTAIFPPNHPALEELRAAEQEVAEAKWEKKADATLKAIRAAGKGVVKDGNSKADYAGFEGNMFVSMRSKVRPNMYDKLGEKMEENDGSIYSGCYAHVILEVWAQDNSYGKRINAQVTGVRLSRDGDSFGGGATPAAADDFADLSVEDDSLLS